MPHIYVTAPEGKLGKTEQDVLMSRISDAVLTSERAPLDHDGAQSLVWAYYDEQPSGSIYVGGENLRESPFRIAVTTPAGALNSETRKDLVEAIGSIVDEVVGPFDGRLNQWTMLYEIDEGSWAGSGQIFPLAGIQAAMGIEPETNVKAA
jgi:hypothetical protein